MTGRAASRAGEVRRARRAGGTRRAGALAALAAAGARLVERQALLRVSAACGRRRVRGRRVGVAAGAGASLEPVTAAAGPPPPGVAACRRRRTAAVAPRGLLELGAAEHVAAVGVLVDVGRGCCCARRGAAAACSGLLRTPSSAHSRRIFARRRARPRRRASSRISPTRAAADESHRASTLAGRPSAASASDTPAAHASCV